MSKEERQIADMTEQLKEKKEKVSELKGERKSSMKRLEVEGCNDVKEAEKEITAEENKAVDLREQLKKGTKELEEKYEWE